jgi:hypothetical protein
VGAEDVFGGEQSRQDARYVSSGEIYKRERVANRLSVRTLLMDDRYCKAVVVRRTCVADEMIMRVPR